MMKVLHLASWYPNRTGGQEGDFIQRHLEALAVHLPVYVIHVSKDESLPPSHQRYQQQRGGLTETSIYYNSFKTGIRVLDKLISFRAFKKHFKKEIANYISTHGKPELIHLHVAMRAGVLAVWAKKKYGIPFIVSEHWSGYFEQDPDNYFNRNKIFRYHTKNIIENASYVTAVSQDLLNRLKLLFRIRNVAVVYNVVDTKKFFYSPQYGDTFRLLHISNMHPIKNVEGIFNVLASLKKVRQNWTCRMVGEIDERFRKLAAELEIDQHIEWTGSISHAQVPVQFHQSHALLMFSDHETLSCVACESLCSGVPVLATAVGGLREIVNDQNGLLSEPRNEEELLANILRLIETYEHYEKAKFAAEAAGKFNYEEISGKFLQIYLSIGSR